MNLQSLITQRLPEDLSPVLVLSRTVEQVNKDAGVAWVSFRPNRADEATITRIANEVRQGCEALLRAERGRLQQVLYRFDLKETQSAMVLQEKDLAQATDMLTQFLLDRALSKVLMRFKYS